MVTTEPTVPSVQLLGLGSKLYPSSMLRMLNIAVTLTVTRMMTINILEVAYETASKLYQGYPAYRGDIFSFLPGLTVFSQLLNVREINIFPAKLNLESKLRLPHYFHLGNKILHIVK